jgi:hypothetical protein
LYPRQVILAEDETDILLFPPLQAGWALRGEQAAVPITGFNSKRVLFGTINLATGHRLLLDQRNQRAVNFQEFLWMIRGHYRGRRVALLLDEDPSHTAAGSQQLAAELDIELIWLPKRSPELNPMDHLWWAPKKQICANRQYATIREEVKRVMDYVLGLSPHEALLKAGILSPSFWLR